MINSIDLCERYVWLLIDLMGGFDHPPTTPISSNCMIACATSSLSSMLMPSHSHLHNLGGLEPWITCLPLNLIGFKASPLYTAVYDPYKDEALRAARHIDKASKQHGPHVGPLPAEGVAASPLALADAPPADVPADLLPIVPAVPASTSDVRVSANVVVAASEVAGIMAKLCASGEAPFKVDMQAQALAVDLSADNILLHGGGVTAISRRLQIPRSKVRRTVHLVYGASWLLWT